MKKKRIILSMVIIIMLLCIIGGGYIFKYFFIDAGKIALEKINFLTSVSAKNKKIVDDWNYSGKLNNYNSKNPSKIYMESSTNLSAVSESLSDSTLGFSTGGAKNINNFRENIKNGYFPISTDITYNGLFYDYYFNTGKSQNINSEYLFSPSYSTAISKDPVSGELEYYMTVGLNSNIKQSDFQRKKLNLVVVLDISGSMSSSFNSYYYDRRTGEKIQNEKSSEDKNKTKMQIANESVNLLIDELNEDDRLGIVLFDDDAYLAKPLNLIQETDVSKIKEHVLEIEPQGGTDFQAGYVEGTKLFEDEMLENSEYENRIIVITDAMPNMGETSKSNLVKYVKNNADNGIYTSFIGVGVDFNTHVIESLSNVKGANYYSVHSSEEFKKIMSEDFDYMVTPLVFDLELNFESDIFSIEKVYGSDIPEELNSTKTNIMKVNTLFPSSSNNSGEAKGGIILLKLKCNSTCGTQIEDEIRNGKINLSVSYKDRSGKQYSNVQDVCFNEYEKEYYDNTGIRKGIVLSRYANLMKNWILFERSESREEFFITGETGILDCVDECEEINRILGENERTSVQLSVSDEYGQLFKEFYKYMENEIDIIGDEELKQELDILSVLLRKEV